MMDPSDMRVEEGLERVLVVAMAVDKRAVVIAAVVCVGMMAAVVSNPGEDGALKRHGTGCAQQIGDPRGGLKALV
jgi:hypothetical protein